MLIGEYIFRPLSLLKDAMWPSRAPALMSCSVPKGLLSVSHETNLRLENDKLINKNLPRL